MVLARASWSNERLCQSPNGCASQPVAIQTEEVETALKNILPKPYTGTSSSHCRGPPFPANTTKMSLSKTSSRMPTTNTIRSSPSSSAGRAPRGGRHAPAACGSASSSPAC